MLKRCCVEVPVISASLYPYRRSDSMWLPSRSSVISVLPCSGTEFALRHVPNQEALDRGGAHGPLQDRVHRGEYFRSGDALARSLARSALHILAPPLLAGNRKTCCNGQDLHELVRPPVTGLLRKRVLAKYQLHSLGKKGQNNRG